MDLPGHSPCRATVPGLVVTGAAVDAIRAAEFRRQRVSRPVTRVADDHIAASCLHSMELWLNSPAERSVRCGNMADTSHDYRVFTGCTTQIASEQKFSELRFGTQHYLGARWICGELAYQEPPYHSATNFLI